MVNTLEAIVGLGNVYNQKDEAFPIRMTMPMAEGPVDGSVPDMDFMLADFYQLRRISVKGIPERDILEENGLHDLAALLYS